MKRLSVRWVLAVVVVILAMTIGLAVETNHPSHSDKLTTVTTSITTGTYPTKNLPPSRDNDSGHARMLDTLREHGSVTSMLGEMQHRTELYELLDYASYQEYDANIFNFDIPH